MTFVQEQVANLWLWQKNYQFIKQNTGQIFLHDPRQTSLTKAKERFRRSGFQNIQYHSEKTNLKRFRGKFDSVILDVPCSGSGTYRRNPETKLEFEESYFQKILYTQRDILSEASIYVKPKGRVFYMTCSVFEDENFSQVNRFMESRSDEFNLIYNETVWPESGRNDGFFLAILEKN